MKNDNWKNIGNISKRICAILMVALLSSCKSNTGAEVPQGTYYNGMLPGSLTINGTNIIADHVWWQQVYVTTGNICPRSGYPYQTYLESVWEDVSQDRFYGGAHWGAYFIADAVYVQYRVNARADKYAKTVYIGQYGYNRRN